mmetsp:Transcript_12723/g.16695  ORF Transcript_12723/g.16695 Transcript_12723/m.16695 type:complete len:319 (+) Transcript_12723:235-1191(+)|eukprot:CAMPEP_0198149756 /NCGR_PEP_ID=MMETSP1443-20131203/48032_1 /TAXON_ID=186043 /ORGANISM="Entomoneis sp., Strain CCMP2396" /LENGTH=318 /DNA_ID=CAMNT_0043814877 /DNA_START=155 /DNA_END=1111 /DNA_ORIENTATION=+
MSFNVDQGHHKCHFDRGLISPRKSPSKSDDITSVTAEEEDSCLFEKAPVCYSLDSRVGESDEENSIDEDMSEGSFTSFELRGDNERSSDSSFQSIAKLMEHNDSIACLYFDANDEKEDDYVERFSATEDCQSIQSASKTKYQGATRETRGVRESAPIKPRSIAFVPVTVHYYTRVIGDCIFCSSGPPVALGTKEGVSDEFGSISDYEQARPEPTIPCPRLSTGERRMQLRDAGCSNREILDCLLQLSVERKRREKEGRRRRFQERALAGINRLLTPPSSPNKIFGGRGYGEGGEQRLNNANIQAVDLEQINLEWTAEY